MWEFKLKSVRQALKIYEEAGNMNGAELARNQISIALPKLGRLSEAIELGEKILQSRIKKYGLEHDRVATVRYSQGVLYMETKQWEKAETQMRTALSYYKKTQSPMSSDIRGSQAKLAEILRDTGKDVDEAARLYKEALDWKTVKFGKQHPTVLLTAAGHARCLQLKGLTSTALKTYKEAYPIMRKTWGDNARDVKNIRSWMEAAGSDEKKEEY